MFAHLNKLKFTPIFITSVIFIIVFTGTSFADTLENRYEPYPIIFVHGYNNMPERVSEEDLWKLALEKFEPFFSTDTDTKYFSNFKYCQIIDYRAKSNGNIDSIADDLKDRIDYVLDKVLAGRKEEDKKVIIVAHSMGGLVVRRLLDPKKYPSYQNKIERVVFIGTPHLGSPLATGVILTDRMIPKLQQALAQNDKYSMPDMNPILCWQSLAYRDRYNKIASALVLFNKVVNWDIIFSPKEMLAGDPTKALGLGGRYDRKTPHNFGQGVAVGELVVPTTVTANKTFIGKASILTTFPFSGITIAETEPLTTTSGYTIGETYLNNNARALPSKLRLIKGTGSLGAWLMGKPGGSILKSLASYSDLPSGNTFDDLETGDGIVTILSQTEPPCPPENIYTVDRCHITETNAWETILKAVDDSPVIENMRALGANKYANGPGYFVYVITKVKDYLLADIEISSMTVDGNAVNLGEFDDGTGHYKPYVKFKKNLLKERPDSSVLDKDENVVTLKPGEFYAKLYLEGNDPHIVNIDLKNPSDNPHATASLTIQRPIITDESPTGTITDTRPAIEAQIQSPLGTDIYAKSIVMKVNGSAVSHTTSDSGSTINIHYKPTDDLDDGQYTVTVDGKDINGIPAEQKEWTFTIQTQRPIITNETPKGDIIDTRPTIGARIYSPVGTPINLSSLNLKLDGYTVSHSTSGSGSDITVSYAPPSDLTSTTHTVHLYGEDINGLSASKTWSFAIKPGYFVVEIPPKIAIGQDFTMKVTAYNGLGQVMDGQDGRELYNEDANVTISGNPAPQGSLTFTHINSGGWVNGVWQATNQCYSNSTEEKYKLTITVTDSGGNHAGMTGEAETIVGPIELILEFVGGWGVNTYTGGWEGFYEGDGVSNSLVAGVAYTCNVLRYRGIGGSLAAYLYKIQIPIGSHINNINIALRRDDCNTSSGFYGVSTVYNDIYYALFNRCSIEPRDYPLNIPAEVNIDYSFDSPCSSQTPIGVYNLLHESLGGNLLSSHGYYRGVGGKAILTYLPVETIIKTIPLDDPNITTVWVAIYVANIQSMVGQIEPHAMACLYNQPWTDGYEWGILVWSCYGVTGVYGYNK